MTLTNLWLSQSRNLMKISFVKVHIFKGRTRIASDRLQNIEDQKTEERYNPGMGHEEMVQRDRTT